MGRKKEDFTGRVFNRLTVIKENGKTKSGDILWLCQCNCENKTLLNITASNLRRKHTQSCGCLQKENLSKAKKKYNTYDLSGEYGIGYTNKGEEFYFDLEDYDKIKDYCWYYSKNGYVISNKNDNTIYLHRLILNLNITPFNGDHKIGRKKDNRKKYLRECTQSQNSMNKEIQSNNTSGVVGVNYFKPNNKWRAYITLNGKQIHLGYFNNKEDAIEVRKQAEEEYFGEFSFDNSRECNI